MKKVKEFYTLPSGKKVNAEPIRRGVKKYLKTEKGKKNHQDYVKAHKEEHHEYQVNYHKNRRSNAFKKGLCTRCCKEPKIPGMTICKTCRESHKKYYHEHKEAR